MSTRIAQAAGEDAVGKTDAPDAALRLLQSEMEALLQLLPGTGLHLPPPGQPDDAAIEASFDNMPV